MITRGDLVARAIRFTDAAVTDYERLHAYDRGRVQIALDGLTLPAGDRGRHLRVRVVTGVDHPLLEAQIGLLRLLVRVEREVPADAAEPPVDRISVMRIVKKRDAFADAIEEALTARRDRARVPVARRATSLAARVAGPQRPHLNAEWGALLAGAPEDGITFSSRRQAVMALQFIGAAVRMRLHDVVRPAWLPVDWVLRTGSRTNGAIATVVGSQAIYIVGDGGVSALVTDVWEPCGIAGAALFALSRWLRRVRGIELGAAEREQADE